MLKSEQESQSFGPAFLSSVGLSGRIVELKSEECFFTQGFPADCVYCLQEGRVKVSVVSPKGKQAIIALLLPGDLFGEEALARTPGLRKATAVAACKCTAIEIKREEMLRAIHRQHDLSDHIMSYLLDRNTRIQDDLVDHMFNSGERRLARALLLMAETGKRDELRTMIPPITQETLAEMIGTTRSRVSFFMNRFRDLGLIDYKVRIHVYRMRLQAVLLGEIPEFKRETELAA
jgi:CRP-like cAMP-binding protein